MFHVYMSFSAGILPNLGFWICYFYFCVPGQYFNKFFRIINRCPMNGHTWRAYSLSLLAFLDRCFSTICFLSWWFVCVLTLSTTWSRCLGKYDLVSQVASKLDHSFCWVTADDCQKDNMVVISQNNVVDQLTATPQGWRSEGFSAFDNYHRSIVRNADCSIVYR